MDTSSQCSHINISNIANKVVFNDCSLIGKRICIGICWKCGPSQKIKDTVCTKSCPARYDYICCTCGQKMVIYGSKTLKKRPSEPHTIIEWQCKPILFENRHIDMQ